MQQYNNDTRKTQAAAPSPSSIFHMHSIKHPGNSGDIVRVAVSEKGETVVWKSAQGSRAVRLEAQAAKQRHMFHVVREVFARDVFVPQILSEAWTSRGEKEKKMKNINFPWIMYI
jgi:hypothetical protein